MPQWGNNDVSSNTVLWAAQQLEAGSGKAAKAANNIALYGNTTPNAFINGLTVGVFGIDKSEVAAAEGSHAGWNIRTVFSGGRAGRVQYETLVAMNGMTGDSDGTIIPNATLTFTSNPVNASANSTAAQTATFTGVVTAVPFYTAVTYQWQANSGGGFANVTNGAVYGNTTTASLTVINTTGLNGVQYKLNAFATGAVNVSSTSATLTVTT